MPTVSSTWEVSCPDKKVPQHIHGNASCMGWGSLLSGTTHFAYRNITFQEPKISQAYLNNFQCSLLLVHICCSQRYEIQWWWKMLHVMTLVLWMKRRLLHNRRIILTPVSSSFSVHIFWDVKIGCIIHYLFYYDVWMCIDHCFVLGWCANDKQIPTIPVVCKKWQVS